MTQPATLSPAFDYVPGLDGLRALAVLLVLVAHLGFNNMIPGGFGVTLFFFISGMLITRLLLAEYQVKGHINILRFYARRLLRLYPALLAAVVTGTLVGWYAGADHSIGRIMSALFYYINFHGIAYGFGQGREGFDSFSILWSLAIEQQYYLLYPLLLLPFIRHYRHLLLAILASVIVILLWRSWLHYHGASSDLIYMRTDTRIDSILYGALLTLILAQRHAHTWLQWCSRPRVLPASVLLLLSTFVIRDPHYRDTVRYTIEGVALMPIITIICFSTSASWLTTFLEKKPLRLIGLWSYSIYLFHAIAIVIAETIWGPGSLGMARIGSHAYAGFVVTTLVLTFIMAMASYYGIEQPLVALRRKIGSHATTSSSGQS